MSTEHKFERTIDHMKDVAEERMEKVHLDTIAKEQEEIARHEKGMKNDHSKFMKDLHEKEIEMEEERIAKEHERIGKEERKLNQ